MEQVFINGELFDSCDAKISVFDRGFLFGDSIYEVLPVYQSKVLFIDRHMARLKSNLQKVHIPLPDYNWNNIFQSLLESNSGGDTQIYLQISRGDQGARKHDFPKDLPPTVVIFLLHGSYANAEQKNKGLSAMILDDIRWDRCDIKTNSLLANILLNDQATSSGFDTSILIRNGMLTEGSAANFFIVNPRGEIKTSVLNHFCLPGITRDLALELMQQLKWNVSETDITVEELFEAQEIWLTSTTKEIFPITKLNDKIVGKGIAGSYWQQIDELYQKLKSSYYD